MSYATSELRRLLDKGPALGEDFFRVKVSGSYATNWLNVTEEQLELITVALEQSEKLGLRRARGNDQGSTR